MAEQPRAVLVPRLGVRRADGSRAAAVVVRGDRVEAVLDRAPEGGEALDGCLVPGFTDAHVHLPSWALAREELAVFGVGSAAEVAERAGEAAAAGGDGWLRGRGWREDGWPDAPHRTLLDEACGDRPVALRSHDGHSLWLSSAALALADRPLDVPGGVVERDADGAPTGVLREESAWAFFDRHAAASDDEVRAALRRQLPVLAARGVVAVHDKDGGRGMPGHLEALGDEVPLRVWQSIPPERLGEDVRAGYVKSFMDGALGSRTAWLLDGTGVCITDAAALEAVVRDAAAAGLPVAVHAIGDRAVREALDGFQAAGATGLRHRIEHAQCVHPDDLPRFAELGVAASVQPSHAVSDERLAREAWPERLDDAYRLRSLLDAGAVVAGGSDAPVEPLDVLAGMRAAVQRDLRAEETVSPAEALALWTSAPAWLEGAEHDRGDLRPGLLADAVLLSHDPVTELAAAEVRRTMLGGRWVA